MNKKILLLLSICIFSVLTLTAYAGDTACGLGGCSAATTVKTTGSTVAIPLTLDNYTLLNVTWLAICGNATSQGPCFGFNRTISHNATFTCNATTDVSCDPASLEYINQVLNFTWFLGPPPFGSPLNYTAVTVDNNGDTFFAYWFSGFMASTLLIGKTNPITGITTMNVFYNQSGNLMNINPSTMRWDTLADGTLLLGIGGQNTFGGDLLAMAFKVDNNANITEEIAAYANNTGDQASQLVIGTDTIGSHAVFGFTETTGTSKAYLWILDTYPALMNFSKIGINVNDIFFSFSEAGPFAENGIIPLDNTYSYQGTTRQAFNIYYNVRRSANGLPHRLHPAVFTLMPDRPYLRRNATVWDAAPQNTDWIVGSVAEVYGPGGRHAIASGRFRNLAGPPPVLNNLTVMRTGPLVFSSAVQNGQSAGLWASGHRYPTVHPNNATTKMCSPDKSHVYIGAVDNNNNTNLFVYGSVLNRLAWYQEQSGDAYEVSWAECDNSAIISTNLRSNININLTDSRIFVLEHSNLVSAFEIFNMSADSIAVINSDNSAPHNDDFVNFVIGGVLYRNNSPSQFGVLDFINTSLGINAINPNGTTRFTTDKEVAIRTMHPDMNILNFQLDFQTFNGTFDTGAGTCTNCSYDLDNLTCQAEVEKVWGMFQQYNLTMSLTTASAISMSNLTLQCRTANQTVTAHSNCAGLFSTYGVGKDGCMTWQATAGRSWVIGANTGLGINLTGFTSANLTLGTMTPTPTCEQIACQLYGVWSPGDTQNFVMNKTITVTAI